MKVKTQIPGLREATLLNSQIRKAGIHDVELMYDSQVGLWAVTQVHRPSGRILTMNTPQSYATEPQVMWWCRDFKTLRYRTPNDQDLSDIIITVKRSQLWFDKGSDKMIDMIEDKEKADYASKRTAQSKRIRSFSKPMKKAIKKELL